jgi:uncharacterized delta-60 repeat protein
MAQPLVDGIVRLNSDGTRDTAFTTNTSTGFNVNGYVYSLALQSDGKIVMGGTFTSLNGITVNGIVRLNSDGTRDTAFTTNTGTGFSGVDNLPVQSIAIQSDGKIIVGGDFTTFNGATANGIIRLNTDGTRDTTFTANAGTGVNDSIQKLVIQPDGKIVIGGFFSAFNGINRLRLARIGGE